MTFLEHVADSSGWPGSTRQGSARPGPIPSDHASPQQRAQGDNAFLARSRRSVPLNRIVEDEILPRLALARAGGAARPTEAQPDLATTESDTDELVQCLLDRHDDRARDFIAVLECRGVTPASLYLGVISQAARRLGESWDDDRCDFTAVTIGLGRLQQAVRALSPGFQSAAVNRSAYGNTVLLLPAHGEQHTLGLAILSEFFLREGWQVTGGAVPPGYDAAALVRSTWVDIVGFSISSISRLDDLAACIRSLRKASRNRDLGVLVGGPLFLRRPDLVTRVGADTMATDALNAVGQANRILAMRAAAN